MKLSLYPALAAALLGAATIGNQKSGSPLAIQAVAANAQNINGDPLTLEEIIANSETIFSGVCTKVEKFEKDPKTKLSTIEFTFKIAKGFQGVMSGETKFKQYGLISRLPVYEVGKKYVLFLSPPSKYGLTSPVGGNNEGCFEVRKDETTKEESVIYEGNEIEYGKFLQTIQDISDKKKTK